MTRPVDKGTGGRQGALHVLSALLVLSLAVATLWWVRNTEWPIEVVRIDGETRFSDREMLQDIVSGHARRGFFGMDLGRLRDDLEAMPWVRDVTLRRIWPDVLTVDVREHRAAARWNEDYWVSSRGVVFPVTDRGPENLPQLRGPAGRGGDLLQALREWSRVLEQADLEIRALEQDQRRHWDVELVEGPVIRLGREDPAHRLERFARAWTAVLEPRRADIATVDFRYTNGFAVAWRDEAATESPEGGA